MADTPFPYDRPVTGKSFIGRKSECILLESFIRNRQHALIIEPPKSGKRSVVYQSLYNLRIGGYQFSATEMDLTHIRDFDTFLTEYASALFKTMIPDISGCGECFGKFLCGIPLEMDTYNFKEDRCMFSLKGALSDESRKRILQLAESLAQTYGTNAVVIFNEFQNFSMMDCGDDVFILLENAWKDTPNVTYIICGSMTNAMKRIFLEEKYFYRFAERIRLMPVDEKEFADYVSKGFGKSGKVIEKELSIGAVRLFEGNCWYLNQLFSICDALSRGYINEHTLLDALKMMLAMHSTRFVSCVNGMTGHQLSFVRAILDGVRQFSSCEVTEKYRLNSSANVKRVREALQKKEIVTFDDDGVPHIIDPLFKYWIQQFFEKQY